MRSNLTVLEANMLMSIERDDAQEMYLRFSQKDEWKALDMAWLWDQQVGPIAEKLCTLSAKVYYENATLSANTVMTCHQCCDEMLSFMRERFVRMYFPNH